MSPVLIFAFVIASTQSVDPERDPGWANFYRIVTNATDVLNGVPVDYRYNETRVEGGVNSVPGCPKSEAGRPWVYYGDQEHARCYLAGEKGPCEADQVIFIEEGRPFGFCNWKCFEGKERNGDGPHFCLDGEFERMVSPSFVKLVYTLYEQGPCDSENEWLAKVEQRRKLNPTAPVTYWTKCEPRRCPLGQYPRIPKSEGEKEIGLILPEKPECFQPFFAYGAPTYLSKNECEGMNMKYSELLQKCVKKFAFNF